MPLQPGDSAELSAGQMLRHAREAHGLHIEVVAAALKVPAQKLAALEADNIEALPDPVFARALAASVCRALRIDPAPVLDKLPGAKRAVLAEADRTMSGNIRDRALRNTARAGLVGLPSRRVGAVVGLLLVGALVLLFLPQSTTEQIASLWSRLSGREAAVPASGDMIVRPHAAGVAVEPVQPAVPLGLPAVAPVAEAPTAPAPPTEPVPPPPTDTLHFVARGESWIRVAGPGGKTVLERTLKAGETVSLSETELPLHVTVGRSSVIDVQVKGKPFDLAPLTRSGGVARFEVRS